VCFVLQKLMALLVLSAVSLSSVGAVSAAPDSAVKPLQASGTKAPRQNPPNPTPLPAGGAAGIRQAQGSTGGNDWILIGGGILAGAVILLLVAGGGDDDASPSTGTN
jgi:hypothetical protein